jgi:hypothetical protein
MKLRCKFIKVRQERKSEIEQSNQTAINTTAATAISHGWDSIKKVISLPAAVNEGN